MALYVLTPLLMVNGRIVSWTSRVLHARDSGNCTIAVLSL